MEVEGEPGIREFGMVASEVTIGTPVAPPYATELMFDPETGMLAGERPESCLLCRIAANSNSDLGTAVESLYNRLIVSTSIVEVLDGVMKYVTHRSGKMCSHRDVYHHYLHHAHDSRLAARREYIAVEAALDAAIRQAVVQTPSGVRTVSRENVQVLETAIKLRRNANAELASLGIVAGKNR